MENRYYRLEASEYISGKWTEFYGICQVLFRQEYGPALKGLDVPKCLKSGIERNTRSWFTVHGWEKYSPGLFKALQKHSQYIDTRWRVLVTQKTINLIMRGKSQVVEKL